MDGASSVIAIVSLAIQVVDSSQKLFEIWKTIRGAPADIQRLMLELEALKITISQSHGDENFQHADPGLGHALRECKGQLSRLRDKMDSLAADLASSSARKRTRGVLKAVFMKPEIEAMKRSLEEAKSTLTIAKMNLLQLSTNSIAHGQEQILRVLQELSSYHRVSYSSIESLPAGCSPCHEFPCPPTIPDQALLPLSHNKRMSKLAKASHLAETPVVINRESTGSSTGMVITPFGSVRSVSRTTRVTTAYPHGSHISMEHHQSYILHPSRFLALFGISSGLWFESRYLGGPQYYLRPFNAVPATSAVFRFCEGGNLTALKTLFDCGDASVRDMDPLGRTPLWVALHSLQFEVAEFLFQAGADTYLSTGWLCNGSAPISRMYWDDPSDVEKKLSIFYLLQKYCPHEYDETTTLGILGHLSVHYRPQKLPENLPMRQKDRRQMTQRRMLQLLPLLPLDNVVNQSRLLSHMIKFYFEQEALACAIRTIKGQLYESDQSETISNVFIPLEAMMNKLPFRDPESMKLLVQKAKDIHRVYDSETVYTGRSSYLTLTSLAMRQPRLFFPWRDMLAELGHDVREFVELELSSINSPLATDGWSEETLMNVFESEVFPDSVYSTTGFLGCERCDDRREPRFAMVDLPWRRHLRAIRTSKPHDTCCNPERSCKEIVRPPLAVREANMFDWGDANVEDPKLLYSNNPELRYQVDKDSIPVRFNSCGVKEPWPYMVVCEAGCCDGVCISAVYDNDLSDEPYLAPYVAESHEARDEAILDTTRKFVEIEEDESPSRRMPGAYTD